MPSLPCHVANFAQGTATKSCVKGVCIDRVESSCSYALQAAGNISLGQGGYGTVYKGSLTGLNVAIKVKSIFLLSP